VLATPGKRFWPSKLPLQYMDDPAENTSIIKAQHSKGAWKAGHYPVKLFSRMPIMIRHVQVLLRQLNQILNRQGVR